MEYRTFELTKRFKEKEAEHIKAMVEVTKSATANYAVLEKEHHQIIHKMKDAEEEARTEAELKAKMEAKVVELREKVRLFETECIQSIAQAWEEGKLEGKQEGKQEVFIEVKAKLQRVFNWGFRDGWKLAMKRANVPSSSEMYFRENTPIPFLKVGLKESEDEAENEEEDDEIEEAGTE